MANSKKPGGLPPPPPPPPAPKAKALTGERGIFNAFVNNHKALKPYAGQIWSWANNYGGITPTELAATLWFESGGNPQAKSKVGALGLAQIFDTKASSTNAAGVPFFRTNTNISAADKTNPAFAIQYAAWRLSGAVQKYGSIDQAYLHDYNPGYTGSVTPISNVLPKGYVGTPSQTIAQSAGKSVATSQVTSSLKDPWAVQTKKGIAFVNSTNPPKNAVEYGGTPLTRSAFNQVWTQTYADTFQAYTGRQAKPSEIIKILAKAPSVYTLSNQLAATPDFAKSPVYKQHAPGLVAIGKQILGNNWSPSGGIIRQAIAQNWDQATFEQHLRTLPAYQDGPEFKTNLAQNQTVFESIYGNADQQDTTVQNLLKQKTLAGWTTDELASWLRSQPAYKYTPEYQSKSVSFLSSLGLITGQQATLSADQIDKMMAAPAQTANAPYSSVGAQARAGIGVGGATNSA